MAKFLNDSILDLALAGLEAADQQVMCIGQPSTYADATTDSGSGGNAAGEVAVDSSDFTKADGDTSGRKSTVAQQTGVNVDVSGNVDHIALVDDGGSALLSVTTCTLQAVTSGNTATINAYDIEFLDVA